MVVTKNGSHQQRKWNKDCT